MKINKISILLLLISMSVVCYAQKKISGTQSGVLGPGKYIVTGNIKIEAGTSLKIAPGTTFIHESGNYIWEISGFLEAMGTKNDSIYFLSKENIALKEHWSGLRFLENAPTALLDYCVVKDAVVISDFDSWKCEYLSAVNVWKGKGITIKHSRISNNYSTESGGGIYVYGSFALIDSCLIAHNYQYNHAKGTGIFLENSNNSKIMHSVIAYNKCNLNGR
jgi:predicted outer membrane repeat protein